MENLKILVQKLLKKHPYSVYINNDASYLKIRYFVKDFVFTIILNQEDTFCMTIDICNDYYTTSKDVDLTEKEYMEMKWTIESWKDRLDEEALDSFKEFAESGEDLRESLLDE